MEIFERALGKVLASLVCMHACLLAIRRRTRNIPKSKSVERTANGRPQAGPVYPVHIASYVNTSSNPVIMLKVEKERGINK